MRFQLSIGIAGVVYQTLLPRTGGTGRVAAYEVLVGTNALKNLIRQNQISQIRSYMFMGEQYGMQTLEQALVYLVKERQVSTEEAMARAQDRATLEKLMEANGIRVPAELRSAPGQGARGPGGQDEDGIVKAPKMAAPPSRTADLSGSRQW